MSRILAIVLFLALPLAASAGSSQEGVDREHQSAAGIPTLPVNGVWHYAACDCTGIGPDGDPGWMSVPSQSELITVSSSERIVLDITDLYIPNDDFEVYVDGVLVLTTPQATNSGIYIGPDYSNCLCPFADQAAVQTAFSSPRYSHGSVFLVPGSHLINIKDPAVLGSHFGTGLAVRARSTSTSTPE